MNLDGRTHATRTFHKCDASPVDCDVDDDAEHVASIEGLVLGPWGLGDPWALLAAAGRAEG